MLENVVIQAVLQAEEDGVFAAHTPEVLAVADPVREATLAGGRPTRRSGTDWRGDAPFLRPILKSLRRWDPRSCDDFTGNPCAAPGGCGGGRMRSAPHGANRRGRDETPSKRGPVRIPPIVSPRIGAS